MLGDRIKERMIKCELSMVELAQKVGVSRGTVSKWILGRSNPKNQTIKRLAKVLHTTPERLRTPADDELDRDSPSNESTALGQSLDQLVSSIHQQHDQIMHDELAKVLIQALRIRLDHLSKGAVP